MRSMFRGLKNFNSLMKRGYLEDDGVARGHDTDDGT